ncbi:DUF2637 domain-containing protein [Streptomyces sp. NPDC002812]|uniref:DUF2637 domain-containing protein n=1 Tax=Streptomyces sp. NPDC002812 TaxID=3154434 RepID=UPI0033251963
MATTRISTQNTAPPAGLAAMSKAELRAADRTLNAGTWAITCGAMLFSVLTVTPLVESVTPAGWEWTAPILALVVDAAVIIVVRLDSTIARLGGHGGPWPVLLRWMTGLMTLALNTGNSALHRDWVGVAVHSVAPLLLIVTAEAALAYRRAISAALDRMAHEAAGRAERERADLEAREEKIRQERAAAQAEKLRIEREAREYEERIKQDQADRAAERQREERAHELVLEKERAALKLEELRAAAELKAKEDDAARQHALRLEKERSAREAAALAAEQVERDRVQQEKVNRSLASVPARSEGVTRVVTSRMSKSSTLRDEAPLRDEFPGMSPDEKEVALYELYRQARDENRYETLHDNPLFGPGGEFCGSRLGSRLGRTDAAGRNNVRPKFERWYEDEQRNREVSQERELVATG